MQYYLNLPKPCHQVFVKTDTKGHLLQVNLQPMATKTHVSNLIRTLSKILIIIYNNLTI